MCGVLSATQVERGKEAEQLDLALVTQAIQGFDSAFEHLTSAEKREFLQLVIHRTTVHQDRVDVELYDGRYAIRDLAQVTRNGLVLGPRDDEGRNATGRETRGGFAAGAEWLPLLDKARTALLVPGDELRVQVELMRAGAVGLVAAALLRR